jgi:hypothetical protein
MGLQGYSTDFAENIDPINISLQIIILKIDNFAIFLHISFKEAEYGDKIPSSPNS